MTLPVRDTLHEAFFAMISCPELLMECQLSKEFLDHQFVFLHDLEAPAKATSQKGTFFCGMCHVKAEGVEISRSYHVKPLATSIGDEEALGLPTSKETKKTTE